MAEEGAAAGPPPEPASAAPKDVRRLLPLVGLFVALWATLPQYSGPALNTEPSKEVADHIIPAVVVAAACLAALALKHKGEGPGLTRFFAGMVVLLAGFWMLATHLPLVVQAFGGDAPWPGTIYHTSSALAVFGLGLMWTVLHWSDLAAMEELEKAQ
ncbi:MAG: hypothetical protein ACLGI2_08775 [Acidimicrobiia bacterium]